MQWLWAVLIDAAEMESAYFSQDAWLEPCLLKELDRNFSRHNPKTFCICLSK
jgi:hypothetical protein